ncbi:MAG: hypothetical protein EPO61_05775 [Nitrospirae bacterium]|nr:MAG: hypothetical protein EPO61_05775 [Nitrospirota bacterium]
MAKLEPAVWAPYCIIAGTLIVSILAGKGCAAAPDGPTEARQENGRAQAEAGPSAPVLGKDTVFTGTRTQHKQKDSPVKIDRITGTTLEQAGATNIGQSLQDVPGLQPGR